MSIVTAETVPVQRDERMQTAWSTLAVAASAVFVVSLDTTVLYVAFPSLRRAFSGVTAEQLSWVINVYTIVYGALLVPAGRLADRFGRRRFFVSGFAIFSVASLVCGLAPGIGWLIAARGLQAVGGAMLMPASFALVLRAFPLERRGAAIGIWGAVGALAAALGPALGSAVVQFASWRWAFFLNVPLGAYVIARGGRRLQESRDDADTWRSRVARVPALDLSLFRLRSFSIANLMTLVFSTGFSVMFLGNVLFLTDHWGLSTFEAGLWLSPGPLTVGPSAVLSGRHADRVGYRRLFVVGGLLYTLGALLLLSRVHSERSFPLWLAGSMVMGLSIGMILPSLSGASASELSSASFGAGSGVNQAVRQFGSVLGVAIVVLLLGGLGAQAPFEQTYSLLIVTGLSTALLGALLPQRRLTR